MLNKTENLEKPEWKARICENHKTDFLWIALGHKQELSIDILYCTTTLNTSPDTLMLTDLTHFTCTCDSHNLCAMQTHTTLLTAHPFTSEQTADMETHETLRQPVWSYSQGYICQLHRLTDFSIWTQQPNTSAWWVLACEKNHTASSRLVSDWFPVKPQQ